MAKSDAGVIIVGAGHAGGTVAGLLRQFGYEAPITLIGEEPLAPYQRPPLSKAWLKGEASADDLMLKGDDFYREAGVDLRVGERVTRIDREARTVALGSGGTLAYEDLILATGAEPRRLSVPGAELAGVLVLRTAADAEQLKAALGPGRRLAVIGGGYIGLEAAASARILGGEAVVIEREPRILARVACKALSDFFTDYHRGHGVEFRLDAVVEGFAGEHGRITGVRLGSGETVACDAALVGIGAAPCDGLARAAGLDCTGGVVVDEAARTADPHIYAIGDVTHRPVPMYERMFRLESVANALEQARQAASAITGRPAPPREVTWNWSDQYDLKYQFAGLPFDVDEVVIRGEPKSGRFAVFHMAGELIQAVEAVNAPAEFMGGRQLIAARRRVSRDKLADPSVSMKEVAA
ncbi:MAG TPA: FAD-dependent oxidoreductase [Caulobacteraceae bacterium]|jgi:3-phenylpropionate/trans-cinnamate dioxygenase ferredoxin reductase subunit|nr:FAD-dependent oxidoreductase [Caulobacteraceae bacterium]